MRKPYDPGTFLLPRDYQLADWYHERIEQHIREFVEELGKDEVPSVVVLLNDGTRLQATWFGYRNPNMIIVHGVTPGGSNVEALIPQTDIQILVTKGKKAASHKRIGFQTRETESEEQEQNAE